MKTFLRTAVLVIFLAIFLYGCSRSYESKADYFDGGALVEYYQTTRSGSDDYLTMTFNEEGDYEIKFSYTEGHEDSAYNKGKHTLPEDFTISVTDNPKTKVITQYMLPGFLTVEITHGDKTEAHDFQ